MMPDNIPRALRPMLPVAAAPLAEGRDKLFHNFLTFTPVLWFMGLLTPAAALLLVKLAADRWPRDRLSNVVVASWMSIGAAQAVASILNGIVADNLGLGLRNATSFAVLGWVFAGLAIAVGSAWRLATQDWAKDTARLGCYVLVLGAACGLLRLLGVTSLVVPSPLALAMPNSETMRFYASLNFFGSESTLGELKTRLVLFFPWATALGLGGLAIAAVSLRTTSITWRILGIAGGVVGVIFSWSRIAIAALVLLSCVFGFSRLPARVRAASLAVAIAVLAVMLASGHNPISLAGQLREAADQARQGSSIARDLIYEKSYEGFLNSPIIGNGWIGESVHSKEDLPIGSHSSIYGVLYTGGLLTFSCFALAMLTTLAALLARLRTTWKTPNQRHDVEVALGLWVALAMYSPFESLFSMSLPCLFIFTWIGGTLATKRPVACRWVTSTTSKPAVFTPSTAPFLRPDGIFAPSQPRLFNARPTQSSGRAVFAALPANADGV